MSIRTRIRVYGKVGCQMCDAAKAKLDMLVLEYEFIDSEKLKLHELHDGWRDDESVDFTAAYEMYFPNSLPLIRFGEGEFLCYTEAMKEAKQLVAKRSKPAVMELVEMAEIGTAAHVEKRELVEA